MTYYYIIATIGILPGCSEGKASACNAETQLRSLGRKDSLEKETATHSSTLAWKIPWTKEPGGLQSMGTQTVGHDRAVLISITLLLSTGEGNGTPLQCSCLENPMDGGAW